MERDISTALLYSFAWLFNIGTKHRNFKNETARTKKGNYQNVGNKALQAMEYEASQNSKTKRALYKMKTKEPEFEA